MNFPLLLKRSVFGLLYVLLILAGISGPFIIAVLIFLSLALLCMHEFKNIHEKIKNEPVSMMTGMLVIILLCVLEFVEFFLHTDFYFQWIAILSFLLLMMGFGLFLKNNLMFRHIELNAWAVIYIGLPFCFLLEWKRKLTETGETFWPLFFVFLIIWLNDTMAYLGGSLYGRTPLLEKISPKKTVEGTLTGIVFSVVFGYWAGPALCDISSIKGGCSALLFSVFSVWGDLYESSLKRQAGVKDSGRLIPGHGGIWDRMDSFLFVMPVAWLIFQLFHR